MIKVNLKNINKVDSELIKNYICSSNLQSNRFTVDNSIKTIKSIITKIVIILILLLFEIGFLSWDLFFSTLIINIIISIFLARVITSLIYYKYYSKNELIIFRDYTLIFKKCELKLIQTNEIEENGISYELRPFPRLIIKTKKSKEIIEFDDESQINDVINFVHSKKFNQLIDANIVTLINESGKVGSLFGMLGRIRTEVLFLITAVLISLFYIPRIIDLNCYKKTLLSNNIAVKREYLNQQKNVLFRSYVQNDIDNIINSKILNYTKSSSKSILRDKFVSLLSQMRQKSDYRICLTRALIINLKRRALDQTQQTFAKFLPKEKQISLCLKLLKAIRRI